MYFCHLRGQILIVPELNTGCTVDRIQNLVYDLIIGAETLKRNDLAVRGTFGLRLVVQKRLDQMESAFWILTGSGDTVQIISDGSKAQTRIRLGSIQSREREEAQLVVIQELLILARDGASPSEVNLFV